MPSSASVSTFSPAEECANAYISDENDSLDDEDGFVSDAVCRDEEDEPTSDTWTFNARSSCVATVFMGIAKTVLKVPIELKYKNASDGYLLDKMKKEVKHLLHTGREKLHGVDRSSQPVTPLDAFPSALPPSCLVLFKE